MLWMLYSSCEQRPDDTLLHSAVWDLQVKIGEVTLARFANRKAMGLLVLLALSPHRARSRAQLAEALWPNEDPDVTRKRLRQTLAVLRHDLEPAGTPAGALLKADRSTVQLDAEIVQTDVAEYEDLLQAASLAPDAGARIAT